MKKLALLVVGATLILAAAPARGGGMLAEWNDRVVLQTSGSLQKVAADHLELLSNDERKRFRITQKTRICGGERSNVGWTELREATTITVISLPKDDEALSIRKGGLMFTPTMGGLEAADLGCVPFSEEELAARDRMQERRQLVRSAQELLARLDYDVGPVDGLEGPKTRAAIEKFERTSDLPITGEATVALIEALEDRVKETRQ